MDDLLTEIQLPIMNDTEDMLSFYMKEALALLSVCDMKKIAKPNPNQKIIEIINQVAIK